MASTTPRTLQHASLWAEKYCMAASRRLAILQTEQWRGIRRQALARERKRTCIQQSRHHSTTAADSPISPSSSVSQSEVSHFSRLASSWWDPHGPSRLLHLMNPLRHDFIKSCHSSSPSPSTPENKKYTYLDIGCGGGIFASSAARLPSTESVTAIDPTPSVLAVAKSHARSDPTLSQSTKLDYRNCAIEDLPTEEAPKYDIITVFEVLEHIDSPPSFLETAILHLKPGGWLIGSTISRHPIAYLTTKLIAEAPFIGVVPQGTHDWNKYINPSELRGYFESGRAPGRWGEFNTQGVVYLPTVGWKVVNGSEDFGNYFFGVQRVE